MFLNVLTVIAHWQEVFDAFGDMRNERKWNLDVQLMEKITDGPVRFGTKFRPKEAEPTPDRRVHQIRAAAQPDLSAPSVA